MSPAAEADVKPLRILFSLVHPGYVRNYESTIRSLAERGHSVHLVLEESKARLGEERILDSLRRDFPRVTVSSCPEDNADGWRRVAIGLRLVVDYLRYLHPRYARANKLRGRVESRVPRIVSFLARTPLLRGERAIGRATNLLLAIERRLPLSPRVLRCVTESAPDLILVTPLVQVAAGQVDFIKCARALGIPSMLLVHSWDNLTNKGLMRILPNRVAVWNELQRTEAVELHGMAAEDVRVTGSPAFDHWFVWKPSCTREEFCRKTGMDPARPIILYLGSTIFIAPDEAGVVREWLRIMRASSDPVLREAGVLIRPHPQNVKQWAKLDWGLSNVNVWPKGVANPIDVETRSDFFDSLYYSCAVVGVNTSAQIEAGIVGRPVFPIRDSRFTDTQEGTLHFHHLLNAGGGLLQESRSLEDLTSRLTAVVRGEPGVVADVSGFLKDFIRPNGLQTSATPALVSEIESAGAEIDQAPEPAPAWASAIRTVLYPVAHWARFRWKIREIAKAMLYDPRSLLKSRSARALLHPVNVARVRLGSARRRLFGQPQPGSPQEPGKLQAVAPSVEASGRPDIPSTGKAMAGNETTPRAESPDSKERVC